MRGLDHNSVTINTAKAVINKADTLNTENTSSRPNRIFDPDDEKYDALEDFCDPIDSKNIVDCLTIVALSNTDNNNEIISGSIMLEIRRLIVRAIRSTFGHDKDSIDNEILFGRTMRSIECCVDYIVTNKSDNNNFYRSIILFSIASLFDLYEIGTESKEADKLAAFINYFVDSFTKTVK